MAGQCAICNQNSTNCCGGCKLVFYCGKEHQKQHWKESHKAVCSPMFKVETNEILGRYLVATRDIKKGELIFQEPPIITGPKAYTFPICLGCHTPCDPENFHECDGCGYPLCKPQCQVSDLHFEECQLMMESNYRANINMNNMKKETAYFNIVPIRCLLLKKNNPEKFKKLMNLQSHIQERTGTPIFEMYRANLPLLRACLRAEEFDEKLIMNIIGILDTNAFEMRKGQIKVRGLYAHASMMEHNCVPNTRHIFQGTEWIMGVYATVPIKKGENITTTYTQSFWGTIARRQHIRMVKCFDCCCKRCSDPTELGTYIGAIRCTKCANLENYTTGPKVVSTEPLNYLAPWKCTECGRALTNKQIMAGNKALQDEVANIEKKTPNGLEYFLTKYGSSSGGVLHSTNTHIIQVKYALVQMYGNIPGYTYTDIQDEQLQKKIDYCHDLLEVTEIIDPGWTRLRGLLLNELQAAMTIQAKREFNEDKITKQEAQKTLEDAMALLAEAIQILRVEPDMEEELMQKLEGLSKELMEES